MPASVITCDHGVGRFVKQVCKVRARFLRYVIFFFDLFYILKRIFDTVRKIFFKNDFKKQFVQIIILGNIYKLLDKPMARCFLAIGSDVIIK